MLYSKSHKPSARSLALRSILALGLALGSSMGVTSNALAGTTADDEIVLTDTGGGLQQGCTNVLSNDSNVGSLADVYVTSGEAAVSYSDSGGTVCLIRWNVSGSGTAEYVTSSSDVGFITFYFQD